MLRMHKIRFTPGLCPGFRWGRDHDAPPDPVVGWGGGYTIPIPHPLDVCDASFSAPTANHFELGGTCSKDLRGIDALGARNLKLGESKGRGTGGNVIFCV